MNRQKQLKVKQDITEQQLEEVDYESEQVRFHEVISIKFILVR